jgi:hypothetical protein
MSDLDLEARLAEVAAEMKKRGLVQKKMRDGLPWALTLREAAQKLGMSVSRVVALSSIGVLPIQHLGEPMIAAVHVRKLLLRQRRRQGARSDA